MTCALKACALKACALKACALKEYALKAYAQKACAQKAYAHPSLCQFFIFCQKWDFFSWFSNTVHDSFKLRSYCDPPAILNWAAATAKLVGTDAAPISAWLNLGCPKGWPTEFWLEFAGWFWELGSYFRGLPLDKCRLFMNSASSTIQKEPKSSSYLTKHLCNDKLVRIAFCILGVFGELCIQVFWKFRKSWDSSRRKNRLKSLFRWEVGWLWGKREKEDIK